MIYERISNNNYVIRGIGRSMRQAVGAAGVYTFDFDLVSGSAEFANANYTHGHIDRNLNNSDAALNQSTQGSISEGTQCWGFINTGRSKLTHAPSSAINTTYGLSWGSFTTTTTPRLKR